MKFNKKLLLILLIALIVGCTSQTEKRKADSSITKNGGSNYSKKTVDSMMRLGANNPDDVPDQTPSVAEERERLKKKYDQVVIIDSTFVSDHDTLHFHSKYYCLKDADIIEPKIFDPDTQNQKEFVTHPFASDIWLVHNGDTVLSKQFKANDFNPFFDDNFAGQLKKYGSILDVNLSRKNADKSRIVVFYSISIPATDLGIGLFLVIDKNGSYKIVENY